MGLALSSPICEQPFEDSLRDSSRKRIATDIGLLWGAYHFGTADRVEAQVDNFLSTADVDHAPVFLSTLA
jgi:hypothetical protein